MANQETKKRKQQSADFKRVKAKVGKRARKPANETDTSFKTAAVKVGKQNVSQTVDRASDEDEIAELYSTRGRSIEDLASQLRHPASAVRTSAARGLKDAVTQQHATPKAIRSQLAVLMPVCAKCCVDEHSEVRELALVILSVVINKVCSNLSDGPSSSDPKGNLYLKPFVPLLMVHVTSALNSLDRATQLDGTKLVGLLSNSIPDLIAPYKSGILPAYVGILSHRSSQSLAPSGMGKSSAIGKGKKKSRNKKGTPELSPKAQILHTMLSLLRTDSGTEDCSPRFRTKLRLRSEPDLTVIRESRSTNGLFIPGARARSANPIRLQKVEDISKFYSSESNWTSWTESSSTGLSKENICELLGKLRDAFAEATPKDQPQHDLTEILVIIEAVHRFYESFCGLDLVDESTSRADTFFKIWSQLTSLIMDFFPFTSAVHSTDLVCNVNLEVSTLILDAHLHGCVTDKRYFSDVLTFLFSELEKCNSSLADDDVGGERLKGNLLFEAYERLLALTKNGSTSERFAMKTHCKIIETIAKVFFPGVSETCPDDRILRSQAGRKCILLMREIFLQYDWSVSTLGGSLGTSLAQIVNGLVSYLVAWESDFLSEISDVVTFLHNVIRRLDVASDSLSKEESHLIDGLRSGLGMLFRNRKKLGKKKHKEDTGCISATIFELYPEGIQKQVIGLLVMLQAPPAALLGDLGLICARCRQRVPGSVSTEMASLIVESIHTIRKTTSMQPYFGFVSDSMGIAPSPRREKVKKGDSISATDIVQYDSGIELSGDILCQCGPVKVLSLLEPLLTKWLAEVENATPETTLRARAAVFILSKFSSDLMDFDKSLFQGRPSLERCTRKAVCSILKSMPSCGHDESGFASDDSVLHMFLEPFKLLLETQGMMMRDIYADVTLKISDLSVRDQTNLLTALLAITCDRRMSRNLKKYGKDLFLYAKQIEAAVSGGSVALLGKRLCALLEVHLGSTVTEEVETTT